MSALATQIRTLRIMQLVFLVFVVVLAAMAEFLGPAGRKVDTVVLAGIAVTAAMDVAVALFLRRKFSADAREVLRTDPENTAALDRWYVGQLTAMVLFVSIGLFGFAVRFLGASLAEAAPFYLVSLILLLASRPSEALA
jgi:disulfide bond formation protein DsbB